MEICISSAISDEIPGNRSNTIFPTALEVCSEENVSLDIQKIKPIQRTTGSQYLVNF